MKIIHYTLRRDRTPNSANCRRHRFDRSRESDKCTERGGEGKVGKEPAYVQDEEALRFGSLDSTQSFLCRGKICPLPGLWE